VRNFNKGQAPAGKLTGFADNFASLGKFFQNVLLACEKQLPS